jgi:tripartite-type tricarboxylate transporter receptor subunit TctC
MFLVHPGHAQPYPARPVKIIVPTVAGGTVDVITRLIANDLSSRLGVSVFVDNRSGAGNTLGSREAARSDPDGYTPADEQRQRSGHQPAGLQGHRL